MRVLARCVKTPILKNTNNKNHLGTLGSGNHFIEVCVDEENSVWVMLHSGSRGWKSYRYTFYRAGEKGYGALVYPLARSRFSLYSRGSEAFKDYVAAVAWAQDFARVNREVMMVRALNALQRNVPSAVYRAFRGGKLPS